MTTTTIAPAAKLAPVSVLTTALDKLETFSFSDVATALESKFQNVSADVAAIEDIADAVVSVISAANPELGAELGTGEAFAKKLIPLLLEMMPGQGATPAVKTAS